MTHDESNTDEGDEHDVPLDPTLLDAARAYNAAPAVPRDAMWARIQAQRAPAIIPIRSRRRAAPLWAASGIAAALLIGVLIGRGWGTKPGGTTVVASTPTPVVPSPAPATSSSVPASAPNESPSRTGNPQVAMIQRSAPVAPSRDVDPRMALAAQIMDSPGVPVPSMGAGSQGGRDPQLYQLVALQHLGRTEALLVAYKAAAERGTFDARLSVWARDLLSTTRLLLDSPAASDPQMQKLLGDLEVLLAKIAHRAAAKSGQDAKIIDDALGQGEILHRLQTAAVVQGE